MRAWFAAGAAAVLAIIAIVVWQSGRADASSPFAQRNAAALVSVATPQLPLPDQPVSRFRRTRAIAPDAPDVSDESIEAKRFARYDRDNSGAITKAEYLANRKKSFDKLDLNHDGKLSFEEYAAKAEAKFDTADAEHNGRLTPAEFATTAAKRHARVKCAPVEAAPQSDA